MPAHHLIKLGLIIPLVLIANQPFKPPLGVNGIPTKEGGYLAGNVNISNENRLLFEHDVKPDCILEPGERILPGGVIYPGLRVINIGLYPESFPVTLIIDSAGVAQYNQTADVDSLAPLDTITIIFSQPWFVPNQENLVFNVTAFTGLPYDQDPTNDTMRTTCTTFWWVIIDSIPAPPGEFRMGLTDEGDYLWNFTNTTNSYPVFYKLRKSDGYILRQFNFPVAGIHYCLGLTMVNSQLYTTEFYPNPGRIWVVDTLGNLVRNFSVNYNLRGLTWDGQYLWAAEVDSQNVVKMDTLGSINTIYESDGNIQWFMDITYDSRDGTIWANDGYGLEAIKKISVVGSPYDVVAVQSHPAPPGDYPEGITYCEEAGIGYLYTCAAYSQWIWKIKVHGVGISEGPKRDIPISEFSQTSPSIFHSNFAIDYQIKGAQPVEIRIYSSEGRVVHRLKMAHVPAGRHRFVWNGRDSQGNGLQSGIYFIHFLLPRSSFTKKVIFLK